MDFDEIQLRILRVLYDLHYGGHPFKQNRTEDVIRQAFPEGIEESLVNPHLAYLEQKKLISGLVVSGHEIPLTMYILKEGIDHLEKFDEQLANFHKNIRHKILKNLSTKFFEGKSRYFKIEDIIKEVGFQEISNDVIVQDFNYLRMNDLVEAVMTVGTPYPLEVMIKPQGIDEVRRLEQELNSIKRDLINQKDYDLFICHASEDKLTVADPLANQLNKEGLVVWYDKFSLSWGDSLIRSINSGLKNSLFGIVILSKSFFEKEWPQTELQTLHTLSISTGEKKVLPLRYNITPKEVIDKYPLLGDILSRSWDEGVSKLVNEIKKLVEEKKKTKN